MGRLMRVARACVLHLLIGSSPLQLQPARRRRLPLFVREPSELVVVAVVVCLEHARLLVGRRVEPGLPPGVQDGGRGARRVQVRARVRVCVPCVRLCASRSLNTRALLSLPPSLQLAADTALIVVVVVVFVVVFDVVIGSAVAMVRRWCCGFVVVCFALSLAFFRSQFLLVLFGERPNDGLRLSLSINVQFQPAAAPSQEPPLGGDDFFRPWRRTPKKGGGK